jgi:hypothetical protein
MQPLSNISVYDNVQYGECDALPPDLSMPVGVGKHVIRTIIQVHRIDMITNAANQTCVHPPATGVCQSATPLFAVNSWKL